ncbi:MAG: hypothetical protein ACD_7C00090G0001 [uncultured bacterium]|nr:MAG: hypothetical protein ACD_7C00090G0001 [uncultured bacterium]HBR79541.1 hypothetical protein [Candidatus Moranbacteria bacterium]
MKKNDLWLSFLLILLLLLAGCATPAKVTNDGFSQAKEAISMPHPEQMEKDGEQYVTIFPIILDPGLWGVEGFSHKDLDVGIFPVITDGKIKGYALITEANAWADQIMRAVLVGRKKDIGRVVYLSRDGHTMHDISSEEFAYDSDKFEKDANYKAKLFSAVGMNIQEIESFWRKYSQARGLEIPANFQFVEEIKVGSARWEEFKSQLATRLTNRHTMRDGEIRQGYMSLADFQSKAMENTGATPGQRFARAAVIPATIEPISLGVGTIGAVLNGLIAASNGPMEGFYSLAECKRGDLKSRFRKMSADFKTLLQERDEVIYALQQKLEEGGTP